MKLEQLIKIREAMFASLTEKRTFKPPYAETFKHLDNLRDCIATLDAEIEDKPESVFNKLAECIVPKPEKKTTVHLNIPSMTGIIEVKDYMSAEQKEAFKKSVREYFQGTDNASNLMIIFMEDTTNK